MSKLFSEAINKRMEEEWKARTAFKPCKAVYYEIDCGYEHLSVKLFKNEAEEGKIEAELRNHAGDLINSFESGPGNLETADVVFTIFTTYLEKLFDYDYDIPAEDEESDLTDEDIDWLYELSKDD